MAEERTTSPAPRPKANRGPAAGPANRRALVAAAREVFAESGLQAPYGAVARRAGVGQGSLYRHFPDRTALAVAVFDENLTALEEIAADPTLTLDGLLDEICAQAVVSTALIDLINAHRSDERIVRLGDRFAAIVTRMLARERAAGRIGAHIEPADVMLATGMLASELARNDAAERPDLARRARAIFSAAFAPR